MRRLGLLCLVVALANNANAAIPSGASQGGVVAPEERTLIDAIERIEAEKGTLSPELIGPVRELGRFYVAEDRCPDAIQVLDYALDLSRRNEGLFGPDEMSLLNPLMECHVALGRQNDLDRELQRLIEHGEATRGRDDPRLAAVLQDAAQWYELAGRYVTVRKLLSRAIDTLTRAEKRAAKDREAGEPRNSSKRGRDVPTEYDLAMVEPLCGIARAYRLEYMHGLDPADAEQEYSSHWRSKAQPHALNPRLDSLGESSLRRALDIVTEHPDATSKQRVAVLTDLGDWYQMAHASRVAVKFYKDAWLEAETAGNGAFDLPEPLLFRPQVGVALRRSPPAQQKEALQQYLIDMTYTVSRAGEVTDVKVVESNAPKHLQSHMVESLKRTRYRPRFVDGEPVDTAGLQHRQKVYVPK